MVKVSTTRGAGTVVRSSGPTPAQLSDWAVDGVACAPVSASSLGSGTHPAKSLVYTARLSPYVATMTGVELRTVAAVPVYQYVSPLLTVVGPTGHFRVSLTGSGITGATPTGVGPGSLDSPFCLVRFAGATRPVVLLGAGGPQLTLVSTEAWDLALQIDAKGLSRPVTDLATTGGVAGLGGQRLVFAGAHPVLVGLNGAFGYEGAFTAQPPVVVGFDNGHFANVTRSYPALVAPSTRGLWSMWKQLAGHKTPASLLALPALSGWYSVECAVGSQARASAELGSLESSRWITAQFVHTTEQQSVERGYCGG